MIYTVTFNPALDYIMEADELKFGEINRADSEMILPGGKGINVSIMLNNLGIENTATGFIAGFTGNEIKRMLENQGIKTDFVELKNGQTRINVKINSNDVETAINGNGPEIMQEDINELLKKLSSLKNGDTLVLSGSIPKQVRNTIYEEICEELKDKKINIVADATKDLLTNVLRYKPIFVKPNIDELSEIFNTKIISHEEIEKYAKKMQEMGAENVLVSMGKDGAMLVTRRWKYVLYEST